MIQVIQRHMKEENAQGTNMCPEKLNTFWANPQLVEVVAFAQQ